MAGTARACKVLDLKQAFSYGGRSTDSIGKRGTERTQRESHKHSVAVGVKANPSIPHQELRDSLLFTPRDSPCGVI